RSAARYPDLVRAMAQKMPNPFGDEVIQVPFAHHDELIETLDADQLHPPLDVGLQVRRPPGDVNAPYSTPCQGGVEVPTVLPVAVVVDPLTTETIRLHMPAECLGLGRAPFLGWIQRGRCDEDAPRADVDERQDEELANTAERDDLLREEVGLPQRLSL